MTKIDNNKRLDQFYTNPSISKYCVNELFKKIHTLVDMNSAIFLEPSAGEGAFIDALTYNGVSESNIICTDIEPKRKDIVECDFLKIDGNFLNLTKPRCNYITIGNPPFGKRSKLAIDFFNHASNFSDTIAFIVPVQFKKWSVQSRLNKSFKLIHSEDLPQDSFIFKKKPYNVRCAFQIWTKLDGDFKDIRIQKAPPIKHSDFEMWQYNNTKQTLKYFTEYEWDFCVPRQGYYDYDIRIKEEHLCSRKRQWIFFKANNEEALDILFNMDFKKLALRNTTVLGFGKADVVEEYIKLKEGYHGKTE